MFIELGNALEPREQNGTATCSSACAPQTPWTVRKDKRRVLRVYVRLAPRSDKAYRTAWKTKSSREYGENIKAGSIPAE